MCVTFDRAALHEFGTRWNLTRVVEDVFCISVVVGTSEYRITHKGESEEMMVKPETYSCELLRGRMTRLLSRMLNVAAYAVAWMERKSTAAFQPRVVVSS